MSDTLRRWVLVALVVGFVVFAAIFSIHLEPNRHIGGATNHPTPVLVAKQRILKGTSGLLVATNGMYQATTLPAKEVEVGAISDAAYLHGRVSVQDILPHHQLTTDDFTPTPTP